MTLKKPVEHLNALLDATQCQVTNRGPFSNIFVGCADETGGCSPEDDLIISIECRSCGSDCAYKINFQGQTVSGCVDPKDQRWAKELKPDLDYGYAKFVDATKTYDWCA